MWYLTKNIDFSCLPKAGIYKIESPSGNIYIGQAKNLRRRMYRYLSGDHKTQPALSASFIKYGYDKHTLSVLEEFSPDLPVRDKDIREQYYIDYYRNKGITLLNCRDAGSTGKYYSEAAKEKKRLAWLGDRNPSKKPFTQERLRRLSEINLGRPGYWRGKKIPDHVVELSRARLVGNTYRKGTTHSDSTKQKISKSKKGTRLTHNAYQIAVETLGRVATTKRKPLKVTDLSSQTDYIFTHAAEAASFLKMPRYQSVHSVLKSKSQIYKSQYKLTWL